MSLTSYIQDRVSVDAKTGCWLWSLAHNYDGYGVATKQGKAVRAHRLSWEAFNGPVPDSTMVCHTCDVRHCVNPDHLFLGSAKTNAEDMVDKGRSMIGVRHHQSKLTDNLVKLILMDQRTHRQIAADYGISRGNVAHIKAGRNWSHLHDEIGYKPQTALPPAERVTCPQGHTYTEENTYVCSKGKRYCRTCQRKRRREIHQRNRCIVDSKVLEGE